MTVSQKAPLDLVRPEKLIDPAPLYRELRDQDPVHWSDLAQAWFISRYEDVVACFRDPRLSNNRLQLYEYQFRDVGPEAIPAFRQFLQGQMSMKDGAEHFRARRLANQGFTPQALEAMLPAVRRITAELVDRVQPLGRMDVVKELSCQLPPLVISEMLGIPAPDRERFITWAQPFVDLSNFSPGTDLKALALRVEEATRALSGYLGSIIEERRHAPGPDMLSRMILAQQETGASQEVLLANAILLLFAGHTTATDQISNGLHDLLKHPDQVRLLQEDPNLVKSAVEEMLRFNPSVPFILRLAAETFELHGRTIPQGSMVFLCVAAANRDPSVFSEPDRFDVTRSDGPQKHLTFGFGPHNCLGANMARREIQTLLEQLLQRMPGLRLDEEQPPRPKAPNFLFRGFDSLHVRW
ncbi:cytochrome P450 [Vitiosangium sp. GDMCC 1.1324]|uniref:cytochrome P450 n=1 Tax=Vitiosangium sp. (strain GDMCC 1.1324) TaxID=2138576 RepID=UPI000D38AC35|nr:cytochrome P450 [Vitiosangium sp. GDMCC 1.1324]PTL84677.1 cytochrome P450 [Vitiosangium sp. GDMCC 1.1324]